MYEVLMKPLWFQFDIIKLWDLVNLKYTPKKISSYMRKELEQTVKIYI